MAEVRDPGHVYLDEVSEPGALQGVNCVTCHQLDNVDASNLNALHLLGKATYRFPVGKGSAEAYVWGPLDDVTYDGMRVSHSPLHGSSLLSASCHQYNRPSNGIAGQHTYSEWLASSYAVPGPGYRTCQDCHMPAAATPGALCVLLDPTARATSVTGTPSSARRQRCCRPTSASPPAPARGAPGRIRVIADVSNVGAGHSFPTGVAIRNALLVVTATWNGQELTQVGVPPCRSGEATTCPASSPATTPATRARASPRCSKGASTVRARRCGRCSSSTRRTSSRTPRSPLAPPTAPSSTSSCLSVRPPARPWRSRPSSFTGGPSAPCK